MSNIPNSNNFPNFDTGPNNIILQLLGFALWTSSMATGVVATTLPDTGPTWQDVILNMIAKSSPLISTWFLYIINRKTIDTYFKQVINSFKHKKKNTKDKGK